MSTLKVTDLVGFATRARELLNTYKVDMTSKGVDPTNKMAELATTGAALATKDEEQEAAKAHLKTLTEGVQTCKDAAYLAATNACDMVITVYGRSSPQGQEATALRNSIIAPTARRTPAQPNPTPPAP